MVDENNVVDGSVDKSNVESVPKKSSGWFWIVFVSVCALVLMCLVGWVYYHDGYNKGYNAICTLPNTSVNGSSLFDEGYSAGIGYGVNMSIQRMLYYAQNCSVVRINYSDKIYGFVDATCVVSLPNRTVG